MENKIIVDVVVVLSMKSNVKTETLSVSLQVSPRAIYTIIRFQIML
jgi:hypothetical protein